ncbi:hypothetical protein EMPS_00770 [Entomortierella parvispora]|uniref:Uncharacterized protein n=1 Tax=Entomortierella parvispora TaxID=205924 RepID=A0A9P3LS21_9FUNG|nr:hypothetical protein EMPS_00770 [Entomortierella parvispora]
MSSRYIMLMAAVPACYFIGYAYREMYDPDETVTTLNRNPESISDALLKNRLETLKESKQKVLTQLKELEAHKHKLETPENGRRTDIPGRLW